MSKWIGVDLDGTLAKFLCDWEHDYCAIGEPVPAMVNRVRDWLNAGREVKIMTARMDRRWRKPNGEVVYLSDKEFNKALVAIQEWCVKYVGKRLEITNCKDYDMEVLYDDRARQVEHDTGRIIGDQV